MRCLYMPPVKCAGEPCFKGSPDIILMQVVWRVVHVRRKLLLLARVISPDISLVSCRSESSKKQELSPHMYHTPD